VILAGDFNSQQTKALTDSGPPYYFSTGDVLTAANAAASGALTYASIDNIGVKANLQPVQISGGGTTNLSAAAGTYPCWVESQYVINPGSGADQLAMKSIVVGLQTASTTAALADILAIPFVKSATTGAQINKVSLNAALVAQADLHQDETPFQFIPTGGGAATITINPFTRNGHTNSVPLSDATVAP